MLTIIGKPTSINVRKVLWTCTELGIPYSRRDWQDGDAPRNPARIEAGVNSWNRHVGLLDAQLGATGAYVAGNAFSLADIVLGLSVNRWRMTPMARPDYPHVAAWYARLAERPGFNEWCDNGVA